MISFDHDLADEHYLKQNSQEFVEKIGYDCAKWLVEYCMDHYLDLPKFYCHSMNPVGKENIPKTCCKTLKNCNGHFKIY